MSAIARLQNRLINHGDNFDGFFYRMEQQGEPSSMPLSPRPSNRLLACFGFEQIRRSALPFSLFADAKGLLLLTRAAVRNAGQLVCIDPSLGMAEFIGELCHFTDNPALFRAYGAAGIRPRARKMAYSSAKSAIAKHSIRTPFNFTGVATSRRTLSGGHQGPIFVPVDE